MKFSKASLYLAAIAAMIGLAAGGEITEQAYDSASEALDGRGWTGIHSRLRIGFRRIKQRPQAEDIAFLAQSIKRAYNSIHAPLDDDYNFLDFNCTAIEMQDDTAATTTTAEILWGKVYDNLEILSSGSTIVKKKVKPPPRHYRLSSYGISDIGCNLCFNDDDALALRLGATGVDGPDVTVKPPPFAGIKPIQDMLCSILKKEGNKDVFGDVSDCTIFPFESLGSWDFAEAHDTTSTAVDVNVSHPGQAATLSIELLGLTCDEAQDFVDCRNDLMQKVLSDALVIAYNQVNFADDYLVDDFVPVSLELVRGEEPMSPLRGGTTPLAPMGVFRGTSHIQCRACADQDESDDPVMEPFYKLKAVESVFCEMIAAVADKIDALSSLQECSLSVIPVIETSVPTVVLKTD